VAQTFLSAPRNAQVILGPLPVRRVSPRINIRHLSKRRAKQQQNSIRLARFLPFLPSGSGKGQVRIAIQQHLPGSAEEERAMRASLPRFSHKTSFAAKTITAITLQAKSGIA
jgi:hypothetical protein